MTNGGHLLPFLWLRNEDEATLRQGIRDLAASGCGAVCAESRTHPDFLGPTWWRDMDILDDECKRLGLRYYLLDDTHFPSGYANGAAKGTPWCRMMMTEKHMDVVGPRHGGRLLAMPDHTKEQLVAVIAGRRQEHGTLQQSFVDLGGWAVDELIDLTDNVQDGFVSFDVPEGIWRVFVLTANYVSERNPPQFFANPLLPEGGQLMIDTIYEAHYQHLKASFGSTFAGFFSDEPALRAGRGSHAVLGEYPMLPIPWRMDLPEMLSKKMGVNARRLLPGLWYDIGEDTAKLRYALMDLVSSLYGENYSMPIGRWCQEHGVEYIGHVIEQGDAHSRLGQGAGHYFRAVSGQTMSGMDYVLHELKPEFRGSHHAWKSQDFEAEDDFFRYMLPQMTVSSAQLDPKKQGRALCEIFGAYGWQENVSEMRYLAHLLLSRGVNYFTPHAFSLQPFPDPDSPPHFGAFNPLMPAISRLFGEMERTAAILDGGKPVTHVGVLYYAEAEWAVGSSVMKTQSLVRELEQRQITCEIVPIDALQPGRYDVLVIPEAPLWPAKLYQQLPTLQEAGCHIAFVNQLPVGFSEGCGDLDKLLQGTAAVALSQIADWALQYTLPAVLTSVPAPDVHVYPYAKDGHVIYALFNEASEADRSITASFADLLSPVLFNVEQNCCTTLPMQRDTHGFVCTVTLTPGQLLILGDAQPDWPGASAPRSYIAMDAQMPTWTITFPGSDLAPVMTNEPFDLISRYPRYSGLVRYHTAIDLPEQTAALQLPQMYGSVDVLLDGQLIGHGDAAPYQFAVCASGRHQLTLEVIVPLLYRHRDPLSFFNYIDPVGLLGPIIPMKEGEA